MPVPIDGWYQGMTKIVCAAFLRGKEMLLVRRGSHRKWYPDHWDLVGGHVDKGEDVEQALVRECVEEVGLRPTSYTLIDTIYEARDLEERTPFHIFLVTGWTGKDAQLLGDEHSELGWFPWERIAKLDIALEGYLPIIGRMLGRD
jgi:8-oxo-dGTP diphosphatase